ncbi:MAG: hypothetical protein ACMUIG_03945 [Thermoplasmatota archaeon]
MKVLDEFAEPHVNACLILLYDDQRAYECPQEKSKGENDNSCNQNDLEQLYFMTPGLD